MNIYDKLKLPIFERKSDIVRTNSGVKVDKTNSDNMHKIDILNKAYKSGKISKEERDKRVEKINSTNKSPFIGVPAPKYPNDGTDNSKYKVEYNRPNKDKATLDKNNLKISSSNISGTMDPESFKKFMYHYKICKTSDEYNEYNTHRKAICKIFGISDRVVMQVSQAFNNKVNILLWNDKSPSANLQEGSILYHTSEVGGLNRLNGKFRGVEGRFYPTQRVYFHVGKPGGRMTSATGNVGNKHVYQYVGNISNAKVDNEIKGTSVYIETNTSIPVKEIKWENKNESVENDYDSFYKFSKDIINTVMNESYKNNNEIDEY